MSGARDTTPGEGGAGHSGDERPAAPLLRIVSGDPSPDELAALVAVLAAASGDGADEPAQSGPTSQWATPERLLRAPVAPTGWWSSSLPR